MTITPEQAQEWLDGATPGPWAHDEVPGPGEDPTRATEVYPKDEYGVMAYVQPSAADVELIAAAPDMAETIAGMREEWKVQTRPRGLPWREWTPQEIDFSSEEEAFRYARKIQNSEPLNCRIVRRLVGPWEEVVEGE